MEYKTEVKFDHIDPLLAEFRKSRPFYNKDEYDQHLKEFEIAHSLRVQLVNEDWDGMRKTLHDVTDIR